MWGSKPSSSVENSIAPFEARRINRDLTMELRNHRYRQGSALSVYDNCTQLSYIKYLAEIPITGDSFLEGTVAL